MSELDEALARLERAVMRLEQSPAPASRAGPELGQQMRGTAAAAIARVDVALARIERLLAGEG